MPRIVCISDTHSMHKNVKVPDGDILLCAGDITNRGEIQSVASFNEWLRTLPHRHKITIAGNHDFCFEEGSLAREVILLYALQRNVLSALTSEDVENFKEDIYKFIEDRSPGLIEDILKEKELTSSIKQRMDESFVTFFRAKDQKNV